MDKPLTICNENKLQQTKFKGYVFNHKNMQPLFLTDYHILIKKFVI